MVGFYFEYQHTLKQFLIAHPSWKYVEIDLEASSTDTALQLQDQLGISSQCWVESTQGNISSQPDAQVPEKVFDPEVCWASGSWTKDPLSSSSGVLCPYTLSGSVVH